MTASNEQVGGTHYIEMTIEPWDVVDTWPLEQRIGYYRGNAIKYLLRMGSKDERAQEIRKAAHYCAKLAEVLEGAATDLNACHQSTTEDCSAVQAKGEK